MRQWVEVPALFPDSEVLVEAVAGVSDLLGRERFVQQQDGSDQHDGGR